MTGLRRNLRDGVVVVALLSLSFGAGWWGHQYHFANARRIDFDFSKPYFIPRGCESIGSRPTPATANFVTGDRIDIFCRDGVTTKPLILEAIVTSQTKWNFGILVPYGGRDLLHYANKNDLELTYRLTVAPPSDIPLKRP